MPLADGASPGGLGFLVFVVFIVAAVVIFIAMTRSLRRMRSNIDRGDFGDPRNDPDRAQHHDVDHDADRTPPTS